MRTHAPERIRALALPGVYRGIVTTADDPQNDNRVKLKLPQVFGGDETDWAYPANPLGLSQIPAVNSTVWVMFEGGDPQYPVYFGSWKTGGIPAVLVGEDTPGILSGSVIADFSIAISKYSDSTHHFNPPTLTNNSPSAGYIAWSSFPIVYKNVEYTVAAGNSNQAYVYWHYNGGTPNIVTTNTLPALTVDDLLLFINKSGVGAMAQLAQALDGSLIVSGSIFANAIAANTITAAQIAANTITASQIAAGSIGTTQLAASSITATQIAAGAINGMTITGNTIVGGTITGGTITGATFQTAMSGGRIKIDATSALGEILFYSGDAAEVQYGAISAGTVGTGTDRQPAIIMEPSMYNSADLGTHPVYFEAIGRPVNTGSSAQIYAWVYSIGDILMEARQTSSRQPYFQMTGTSSASHVVLSGDNQNVNSSWLFLFNDHFVLENGGNSTSDWVYVETQAGVANLYLNSPYGHVATVDGVGGYKEHWASVFRVSSAARFKRDISTLENPLTEIRQLRPVQYRHAKGVRPTFPTSIHHAEMGYHRSLMADEVHAVIPHAVAPGENTDEPEAISIMGLLSTTIGAVQELAKQVDELRKPA